MSGRTGSGSRLSPTSSTRPATPAPSAPRAARTSWRLAGSSNPPPNAPARPARRSPPRPGWRAEGREPRADPMPHDGHHHHGHAHGLSPETGDRRVAAAVGVNLLLTGAQI